MKNQNVQFKPRPQQGFILKCGDPVIVDVVANTMINCGLRLYPHLGADEPYIAVLVFAQNSFEPGTVLDLDGNEFRDEIFFLNDKGAGYLVY